MRNKWELSTITWQNMIQGSFARLRVPLPISSAQQRQRLLENCLRLSNVRTRCVGVNQIRNVYMPIWQDSEDQRLWFDFESMVFGDIRSNDRVARFHVVVNQ